MPHLSVIKKVKVSSSATVEECVQQTSSLLSKAGFEALPPLSELFISLTEDGDAVDPNGMMRDHPDFDNRVSISNCDLSDNVLFDLHRLLRVK